MSSGHIEITGIKEVLRVIGKAKEETGKRIEDGIRQACEIIRRRAYIYCPKDTGALADSGKVIVTGKGFGCRGTVVFGGPEAHYALYVHEDLSKYHHPPTQAKFLERASRESRGTITNMLKRTLISGTYRVVDESESDINTEPE